MHTPVLRAAARSFTIAIMGITLLVASPSSVVVATQLGDLDGPAFAEQAPTQGGGGAPVQHIPGNAGTGDASSPSGGSKSKPSKAATKAGMDSVDSDEKGCDSDNSGGSDDSDDGDEQPCPTPTPTPTATPTPTPTPTPTTTPVTTTVVRTEIVNVVNNGTEFRVVRVFRDAELVHEVFIRLSFPATGVTTTTETVIVNGQVMRVIRVFTDGQLTHVVNVPETGPAQLGSVLGSQQGPAGAASLITSPLTAPGQNGTGQTNVAGQQAGPLGIASLPSTTPVVPAVPLGALGALIVAGGAWLLGRGRKQ